MCAQQIKISVGQSFISFEIANRFDRYFSSVLFELFMNANENIADLLVKL